MQGEFRDFPAAARKFPDGLPDGGYHFLAGDFVQEKVLRQQVVLQLVDVLPLESLSREAVQAEVLGRDVEEGEHVLPGVGRVEPLVELEKVSWAKSEAVSLSFTYCRQKPAIASNCNG